MGKKRAYVVTNGRQTGIFDTWDEVEPLVKGFKRAKYQGYSSRDDAERAWRQAAPAAPSFATAAGAPVAPAFVPASAPAFVPVPPPPPPLPSIRDMKTAILQAGLGVADLVEKSDVVERYRQALAAARPAAPAFVPRGAASSPPEDPVAAAARAAAVPVRPSNPRPPPMRGSVTTPTRPADDGADARHELTEEQESVCAAAMRGESLFFTGNAGTGKTTTMRELITRLPQRGRGKVFVTASTGAAAVLCRGTTLHSFAGIGLGKESTGLSIKKLSKAALQRLCYDPVVTFI